MRASTTCSEDNKAQPESPAKNSPSPGSICLALIAVYLVWGSTYLGIRFAIESIPGFFMAGSRFVSAGLDMTEVVWFRVARWPGLGVWRDALIVGGCLILGGNGAVTFAEQYVPSGETALMVGCVPILMTLFAWFAGITRRPGVSIFFAMALGIGGVGVLAHGGASTRPGSAGPHPLRRSAIPAGSVISAVWSSFAPPRATARTRPLY